MSKCDDCGELIRGRMWCACPDIDRPANWRDLPAHKHIDEMTVDELNALPEYHQLGSIRYEVQPDGTVTLLDGRVLRGLVGKYVTVPYAKNDRGVGRIGDKTPLYWSDNDGVMWHPVWLTSGEWMKERA